MPESVATVATVASVATGVTVSVTGRIQSGVEVGGKLFGEAVWWPSGSIVIS